jgi:ATP dependent DNA ligase domain
VISAFGQSEIRKVACVRSDQHGAQLAGRRSPYSPSISYLTSRPKGEPGLEPRTKRRVEGHVLFLFQWHRRSGIDPHFNLAQPVVAVRLQPLTPAWFALQPLRHRRNEPRAFLYAFDLLELNGADLRREPIGVREATLASILRKSRPGVRLNEHLEHSEGAVVFQHACKMGLEGIVSKRLGSRYRSGRSLDWLKNPEPGREAGS